MDYTEVHLRRFLASTSLDAAVSMTVSNCPREEGELEKDQVLVLHRGLEYPTLSKAKEKHSHPHLGLQSSIVHPISEREWECVFNYDFFPDYYEM